MNFLKKKLKPLTAGFNQQASQSGSGTQGRNLEDDLYDEYVVEAPPHPSELLALGVEPTEIDVNDPDKLRELYRKAKEEGKDKKTNSVLLARQRQKEEIEEKKRTREEWKFFDSLTSRVEQVVKESQKNLDHWKESSAVSELAEPEYELRQTADEVFRPVTTVKLEKGQNDWIDFGGDDDDDEARTSASQVDEFGCPAERRKSSVAKPSEFVVEELLEDFGIDLRTAEQKRALEEKRLKEQQQQQQQEEEDKKFQEKRRKEERAKDSASSIDIKAAARPRPRPKGAAAPQQQDQATTKREDPKPSSIESSLVSEESSGAVGQSQATAPAPAEVEPAKFIDPFDTSYVNLE